MRYGGPRMRLTFGRIRRGLPGYPLAAILVVGLAVWCAGCRKDDSESGRWRPPLPAPEPLPVGRAQHSAVLLADGAVLVTGGVESTAAGITYLDDSWKYDPASGRWAPGGALATARLDHLSFALPGGDALIVLGLNLPYYKLPALERRDGASGIWSPWTQRELGAIGDPAGVSLPGGEVFFCGGFYECGAPHVPCYGPVSAAWVYDPMTDSLIPQGDMIYPRNLHSASLLPDGRVLVAGGNPSDYGFSPTSVGEIWDPTPGTFFPAAPMDSPHASHSATVLRDGKVLIAGGVTRFFDISDAYQLFDPVTDTWAAEGRLPSPRTNHSAVGLPDGRVLLVGGTDGQAGGMPVSTTSIYEPALDTWSDGPSLQTARQQATATLLPDGAVLVVGGRSGKAWLAGETLSSVEILFP